MFSSIGFVGTGAMGSALARLVHAAAPEVPLLLANRTGEKAAALARELPGAVVVDNDEVFGSCSLIFLAVKPQVMPEVLSAAAPLLGARQDRFVLVSMAAGLTCGTLRDMAGGAWPVVRIMPNVPVTVGAGVIQYCFEDVTDGELEDVTKLLRGAGTVDPLPEALMDAASALSGCGPAYVCQFIEALADGGVACGLPRQKALLYAAQTVEGAARALRLSGMHPGALKDTVCSPGGSTIQGVRALERGGLRSAAMEAVIAACEKNRALGRME